MGAEDGESEVADDLRGDIEAALGDSEGAAPSDIDPGPEPSASPPELDTTGDGPPTRDSLGRFLPKTGVPGPAAAPGTQPPAQPLEGQPAPAQAPAIGPPAGWGFGAREQWANVPQAVQQEVARREYQMQQYVNESAPARQLGETFRNTVTPYMSAIQAEGVDPITAIDNLLQFGNRMRMGTAAEKARTIANVVKAYGIPIEDLDSALVGAQIPERSNQPDTQYVQNAVQQALMPLYQAAQQRQLALQQSAAQHTQAEIHAFAQDPKHRYFQDLRGIMADLVEAAQARGGDMSLQDAYDRAGMLHPEISRAMIAQRQGANAHQLTQAAQRARAAAVSVNGSAPIGNPNAAEPTSIRESIEAAIESHSRY